MLPEAAVLDASARRARAVALAWRDDPAVRHVSDMLAQVPPDAIEQVADAAAVLLADDGWIAPLFAPLIAALAEDPWFEPPLRVTRDPLRTTVQVLDLPAGTLTATVFDGAALAAQHAATLTASGRLSVARYHRAGGARLLRWDAGPADAAFSAATAPPLRPLPPRLLDDGEVVRIDGRVRAHLIEGGGGEMVVLTFATRGGGLMREYDRATGTLLRAATNDEAESRTRMLLTLLRLGERRNVSVMPTASIARTSATRGANIARMCATPTRAATCATRVMNIATMFATPGATGTTACATGATIAGMTITGWRTASAVIMPTAIIATDAIISSARWAATTASIAATTDAIIAAATTARPA